MVWRLIAEAAVERASEEVAKIGMDLELLAVRIIKEEGMTPNMTAHVREQIAREIYNANLIP